MGEVPADTAARPVGGGSGRWAAVDAAMDPPALTPRAYALILATIGLGIILEWCAAQTCSTGPSTLAALSVHWRGVRALAVAALASPPTVHTPTLATVPSIFLG